jgi:hypothetical protein
LKKEHEGAFLFLFVWKMAQAYRKTRPCARIGDSLPRFSYSRDGEAFSEKAGHELHEFARKKFEEFVEFVSKALAFFTLGKSVDRLRSMRGLFLQAAGFVTNCFFHVQSFTECRVNN